MIRLIQGDCLDEMDKLIASNVIVDAIITDPPFGATACKWDSVIPFDEMWLRLNKLIRSNGATLLHAIQPFTSALIMSNVKDYRYHWIWNKNNSAGFYSAKIRPFAVCEEIIVFGKNRVDYYPQMERRGKPRVKGGYSSSENYTIQPTKSKSNLYYPKNLINISNSSQRSKVHPTQKPVLLMEYLIKTYTLPGETVLDFTMGSGTTGVACVNLDRGFIGMEKDLEYFTLAQERIEEARQTETANFT